MSLAKEFSASMAAISSVFPHRSLSSKRIYSLNISLDDKIVALRATDNLCLARKVNDEFSVIFLGKSINPTGTQVQLQSRDTFSWEDQYRVACANPFKRSLPISFGTSAVPISVGQKVTFEKNMLKPAQAAPSDEFPGSSGEKGSAADTFILARIPSRLRAACECKVSDTEWHPIYVDNGTHVQALDVPITPSHDFVIFWDPHLTPNTMFRYNQSPEKYEFSFDAGVFEVNLRFGYITPNQPAADEEATFFQSSAST